MDGFGATFWTAFSGIVALSLGLLAIGQTWWQSRAAKKRIRRMLVADLSGALAKLSELESNKTISTIPFSFRTLDLCGNHLSGLDGIDNVLQAYTLLESLRVAVHDYQMTVSSAQRSSLYHHLVARVAPVRAAIEDALASIEKSR